MANAWGLAWGNPSAWGVSWGSDAAPVLDAGYSDPGFWTEQHRKIKELEEHPEVAAKVVTPLSAIPEFIAPPKSADNEIDEILELMEMMDADRSLSKW